MPAARAREGARLALRPVHVPALPALAWCARVTPGTEAVPVFHGSQVEIHARGFVEGAWDGAFAAFDLARATVLCGTGATTAADGVRFYASTDQQGVLFSIRQRDSLVVSNSPSFALAVAGEALEPLYPFYVYDLLAIFRQGLYCPDGRLRLRSGNALRVHYTTVMAVSPRGEVRFEAHAACAPPGDYRSYAALLYGGVDAVLANARDEARRSPYAPLVTLSRGYDSTAGAVLARRAGAREAFTYVDSRQADPTRDSGVDNARVLGMTCAEHDRWAYLTLAGAVEAEFGYGPLSSNVPLAAVEPQLAGRILVTGESGDPMWDPCRTRVFDRMGRPWIRYPQGLSVIEHRLRVGYVIFAPACLAARHNRAIHAIAVSPEMRPWSIGVGYDRPLPRRLCEEAGLARDAFGTRKFASSHSHLSDARRFSARSLDLYRTFVQQAHAAIPGHERQRWRARAHLRHRAWDLLRPRQRYVRSTPLQRRLPFVLNAPPIRIPWDFMFTFQWTAASVQDRYRVTPHGTISSTEE